MDPLAHANEAMASIPAPSGFTLPDDPNWAGPTSRAKPAKPLMIPRNTLEEGLWPPGRSQSTMTIQRVTIATRSAATPEGTVSSAQQAPPFPIHNSKKPVTQAVVQWSLVGFIPVFHRKKG